MANILITGCRSGLGLELLKQILQKSHENLLAKNLIATCRTLDKAPELKALTVGNQNLHVLEIDLVDFTQYKNLADRVKEIVGDSGLNVLFHNAGALDRKDSTINHINAEIMERLFKINTVAPIILTQTLLPLLKLAAKNNSLKPCGIQRAAIIYMSSVLGSLEANTGGYWGYRESKAASNMFMRTLKTELKNDGISTLILHPGNVKTDMGGKNAPLTPETSVSGLLHLVGGLSKESDGLFLDYKGKPIPW